MATSAKPRDKLLATLDGLLDQAVRVVPRPRTNFSAAIRAMHDGRYDASRDRFRRLEVHELLARDITAAIEAGEATDRAPEFLKRASVSLRFAVTESSSVCCMRLEFRSASRTATSGSASIVGT